MGFKIVTIALLQLFSCQTNNFSELKKALTFYVSFDEGTTADFALGDGRIYTASGSYVDSKRVLKDLHIGMTNSNHQIVKGKGRFGDAFEFNYVKGNSKVIFYKSEDNVAYDPQSWSGSISFWLSVDPSEDLGWYTDPIQITDSNFNDASIWVDFTDERPPNFRLGVIGDKNEWTLDTLNSPVMDVFNKRIVNVEKRHFSRKKWTHVLITYDRLGTDQSLAKLYLNGEPKGAISGIDDHFTWETNNSNIFLGLGFNGLMDELSVFNKPLTKDQARVLYHLKGGIKSIL